jgi:hypothetical protein
MTVINVVQYSSGRTVYNCNNPSYPPTNPKAGTPFSGNTVVWNAKTRETSVVVPRQQDEYIKNQTERASNSSFIAARKSIVRLSLPCDAPAPESCKQDNIPKSKSLAGKYPNQYPAAYPVPFARR